MRRQRLLPVTLAAALVAVVAVAVVAVADATALGRRDTHARRPAVTTNAYAAADAAVPRINAGRADLFADVTTIASGAEQVDRADSVATSTGDPAVVGPLLRRVDAAVGRADRTVRRMSADVASYTAALDTLDAAARTLPPDQRRALAGVVAAGRAERAALAAYTETARQVWPRYADLAARQHRWEERASDGWYRSKREAADAYTVFLVEVRGSLDTARDRLALADARVHDAAAATQRALTAAERVLSASG